MQHPSGHQAPTVAVIGLGYVGSSIAATMADRKLDVLGVDTNRELVAELSQGRCRISEPGLAELFADGVASGRLRVTSDYELIRSADIVMITVGTPVNEDWSLSTSQLGGACAELSRNMRAGQLILLKSTVPPGTSRRFVLPLLAESGLAVGTDFMFAVSPERLSEGAALRELSTFPIVVGGADAQSLESAVEFWRGALGVEVIPVGSLEAAEVVKLASNWWIDHNIALANELAKFCSIYQVDVLDVIRAANTIPKGHGKVNILLPSVGVGGSCLTKDPWMVCHAAQENGVEIRTAQVSREVNAGMPAYTAQLIIDELTRIGKDPSASKVAVLGLAFKNDTGDTRETPVLDAVTALRAGCAEVRLFDPLVDRDRTEKLFGSALAPTLDDAVRDADCVAVFALHRELSSIDFAALPVADECLVMDGRAYYDKETIAALRTLGYHYRGVGR